VEATTHFEDAERVAAASRELGEPMPGLASRDIAPEQQLATRGW
jgi:pyridoxal 5'-phosphate synthase pdxS subunit